MAALSGRVINQLDVLPSNILLIACCLPGKRVARMASGFCLATSLSAFRRSYLALLVAYAHTITPIEKKL